MSPGPDLLGGPPPTLLPDEQEPRLLLEARVPAVEVAARFPTHSAAWAALADEAFERDAVVESYAYARTGYHRGLDALRRNGWKGFGPVPWEHAPNQGFLRARSIGLATTGCWHLRSLAWRCHRMPVLATRHHETSPSASNGRTGSTARNPIAS